MTSVRQINCYNIVMKSKTSPTKVKRFAPKKPHNKKNIQKINKHLFSKKIVISTLVTLCLFILSNLIVALIYKNKTYPKTTLNNQKIGTVPFADLENKSKEIIKLPDEIVLKVKDKSQTVKVSELGLSINYNLVTKSIQQNRLKVPLFNLFITKNNVANYEINESISNQKIDSLKPALESSPSGAYIKLQDYHFNIVPATPLITIDAKDSISAIAQQLNQGKTEINLPFNEVTAPETAQDIIELSNKLNKSLDTPISVVYENTTKKLTKEDISSFYIEKDASYAVSSQAIGKKLDELAKQFGIVLGNKTQAVNEITQAITDNKKTSVTLKEAPKKSITYTYCVSAKGVDESNLGALRSKLQSVYADERGWSAGGQINFVPVSSGCSFTVWLTEANLVPSFSSTICDNIWSCRVGNNVIINFDRWSGASPAWNSAGGSLDNYRSMVINHETGHWLGFGHRYCSGSGQLAPVMQQQSISLQGCSFNPWPTSSEIQSLKSAKGL